MSRLLNLSHKMITTTATARLQMFSNHVNASASSSHTLPSGSKFTLDYKVYYRDPVTGKPGSWFHDVPLGLDKVGRTVSMVVEIPRWSNAKMEITTKLPLNPITQDTKKGKLRFIHNIYPHHGYIHNYGAIPQTWEDTTEVHPDVGGLKGDNDPVDICDLGKSVGKLGDIVKIKVLGSLALIDDGELDWKVIGINVADPMVSKLNDIQDVEKYMPGVLSSTRNWFRDYKIPAGKGANEFAFDGEYRNVQETIKVIEETHESWKKLMQHKVSGKGLPKVINTKVSGTPGFKNSVKQEELGIKPEEDDGAVPREVSEIYYLS
ncbi:inorganic diphosphatase [Saccharomycopsis crataegensis]|uniref:inorganic diphosphatase n=1 Tax=Saccharomycopsis crataegensis TaxID=43959 RepID=A0AAV5QSZ1_9ASCO|nr:inorganic diphosphatase [Saccharomycopsis crataegensis]